MRPLTAFMNLPTPVKAVIFVISGGGLVGLFYLLMMTGVLGNQIGYLLLVALAVAGVVSAVFLGIMKKLEKRKGKPFEQKLAENSAATPGSVSDPGSRAKLDDLRKRFEEGISVFKEHGKDLYTMPWYVIVGEPGSGKTEAMRHSNVGFPPGLQNQLQGVGGTVNMHWWFTNQAVMIDTAGRLMFEDLEPGQTSEWSEFLKLLRTARPNCPLNGMLLVIPADSLIKDSANDIERKGGKIAQQLDNIQRALGVRFPVYIIISKADRINGFREFFDDLTDPILQMQMLGWSNPTDLDTPFDPSLVEQHLKSVRNKLVRRRFSLLADPVHTEDPMDHRIDQVDALYAFPDSLVKLAPRLRRYLEMVFVAGEWSQKPLFLRGIYFTSSMREGDALDADLADVLGVQVDHLKEGKLWERERSYFLKDMFMEKVFRERGLVTREMNVSKSRRRQSAILLFGGILLVGLAGLWTWFGYRELQRNVGSYRDFWVALRTVVGQENKIDPALAMVQPESGEYRDGRAKIDLPGVGERLRREVQQEAMRHAREVKGGVSTSLIFLPVKTVQGDVWSRMQSAQRAMLERYVVSMPLDEMRRRMIEGLDENGENFSSGGRWNSRSVDALATLLDIHSSGVGVGDWSPNYRQWLTSYRYLDTGQTNNRDERVWEQFSDEVITELTQALEETFAKDAKLWIEAAGVDSDAARQAIERGIESFSKHWTPSGGGNEGLLGMLEEFGRLGTSYLETEAKVLDFDQFGQVTTRTAYESARQEWLAQVDTLIGLKDQIDALLARPLDIDLGAGQAPVRGSFGEILSREQNASLATWSQRMATREVDTTFGRLIGAIPLEMRDQDEARKTLLASARERLDSARKTYTDGVQTRVTEVTAQGSMTDRARLVLAARQSGADKPVYSQRFERIALVAEVLRSSRDLSDVNVFTFKTWDSALQGDMATRRSGSMPQVEGEAGTRFQRVAAIRDQALTAYERFSATQALVNVLGQLESGTVHSIVSMRSSEIGAAPTLGLAELPLVPRSGVGDDADPDAIKRDFDWRAAKEVFESLGAIEARVNDASARSLLDREDVVVALYNELRERKLKRYADDYISYWTNTIPDRFRPIQVQGVATDGGNWSATWDTARTIDATAVCRSLDDSTAVVLSALGSIPAAYRGEGARSLTSLLAALEDDRSALAVDDVDQIRAQARSARDAWVQLQRQPEPAHAKFISDLRRMEPTLFKNLYLPTLTSGAAIRTPARIYWSGFAYAMMDALWSSYNSEASASLAELRRIPAAFPLAVDGAAVASPADVQRASELVGKLFGQVAAGRQTGDGARVAIIPGIPDDASRMLARLQGEEIFGRDEEDWIRKLHRLTSALNNRDNPVRVELVLIGNAAQNQNLANLLRRARLTSGDRPLEAFANTNGFIDPGLSSGVSLGTFTLPHAGSSIEFAFAPSEQVRDDVKLRGIVPMPWHGLHVLQSETRERAADGTMLLPLIMQPVDRTFPTLSYYIGVKFTGGPLPPREEWPRTNQWPRN